MLLRIKFVQLMWHSLLKIAIDLWSPSKIFVFFSELSCITARLFLLRVHFAQNLTNLFLIYIVENNMIYQPRLQTNFLPFWSVEASSTSQVYREIQYRVAQELCQQHCITRSVSSCRRVVSRTSRKT